MVPQMHMQNGQTLITYAKVNMQKNMLTCLYGLQFKHAIDDIQICILAVQIYEWNLKDQITTAKADRPNSYRIAWLRSNSKWDENTCIYKHIYEQSSKNYVNIRVNQTVILNN